MKRKQIIILLLLVVVIGGAGLILQKRNQSQWSESAAPKSGKVLDFPVNDVARVEIRSTKGEVHLAKKNGVWVVAEKADYPADFQRVSGLIRQLWELRPVQQIKARPSQFGRLELTEPNAQPAAASRSDAGTGGTVVELKNENDKTVAKIVLGKRVMAKENEPGTFGRFPGMPMGRYVLSPHSGGNISVVNQPLEFDAQPQSWLKRDFIKINSPSSITLSGTPAETWTLTRGDEAADWKLADAKPNEQLDKSVTAAFATMLSSPTFADVLPPDAKPDEHGLDKPDLLTIQTFDGFTYLLKIGKAEANNYPVAVSVSANLAKERTPAPDEKSENKAKKDEAFTKKLKELEEKATSEKDYEKRIYLVAKSMLDPFLKHRADLLAKPTAAPLPSPSTAPRKQH